MKYTDAEWSQKIISELKTELTAENEKLEQKITKRPNKADRYTKNIDYNNKMMELCESQKVLQYRDERCIKSCIKNAVEFLRSACEKILNNY